MGEWVDACSVGSEFGLVVQLVKRVSITMRKGVGGKGVIDMHSHSRRDLSLRIQDSVMFIDIRVVP